MQREAYCARSVAYASSKPFLIAAMHHQKCVDRKRTNTPVRWKARLRTSSGQFVTKTETARIKVSGSVTSEGASAYGMHQLLAFHVRGDRIELTKVAERFRGWVATERKPGDQAYPK